MLREKLKQLCLGFSEEKRTALLNVLVDLANERDIVILVRILDGFHESNKSK